MTIGKQIKKRRKELKMSADELARRLGKDRSTIYRYENGNIENIPIDMLFPITDALDTTPQELLSSIVTNNKWLTERAEQWFEATDGYEFSDDELKIFYEVAKYFINNRNTDEYEENIHSLFILLRQLNK